MNYLICNRGLPGSGKSYLAARTKEYHEKLGNTVFIFSTDDFWGIPYNYIPEKLREAHLWNQNRFLQKMIQLSTPPKRVVELGFPQNDKDNVVIIDNTNVQAWELRPYVTAGVNLGWAVSIEEPCTPWSFDPEECAKRNSHGVPLETIKAMLNRWEKELTIEQCLNAYAPWEKKSS